jgi:hypothetical protein
MMEENNIVLTRYTLDIMEDNADWDILYTPTEIIISDTDCIEPITQKI